MSNLSLYLLGSPQIVLDGAFVTIRRSKAMALLFYLALIGEPQRRDTLATLLWPDSTQTLARSSLRRELSLLKKALEGKWLVVERESIGLHLDIWLDVTQFQEYLAAYNVNDLTSLDNLSKAIVLYRDDFLKGFTLPDCIDYDEWQFFHTESLRQSLATALEQLVNGLINQHNYETAILHARRWLSIDPLHEPAHQILMRVYALSGRQAAALHQFSECQRLLREELGIEPDAETLELEVAIRDRRFNQADKQTLVLSRFFGEDEDTSPGYAAEPRPLFVGRKSQLDNLEQALKQVASSQGQIRFIKGEAGAGKSALVSEFIHNSQSDQRDLLVMTGFCDAQTGAIDPYLPFREGLKSLLINRDRIYSSLRSAANLTIQEIVCCALLEYGPQLLYAIVPTTEIQSVIKIAQQAGWRGDIPQSAYSSQGLEQNEIFEQAVAVLQAIAVDFPLIIVLEDIHWADSGSLGILFRLARQLLGHSILIICTYRPEAVQVNQEGVSHSLKNMLIELQRNLNNIFIDLDEARKNEGQLLVDGILDAEPNRLKTSFRHALYHQTGGHPLFVVELVQDLKKDGGLIQDDDNYWVLGNRLDWFSLPTRVEGAIAGRMAHLTEAQRWLLTIASVMGENFLVEIVAHVAGEDPRQLTYTLSRVLQKEHRLVEAEGVERLGKQSLTYYRFRHNLMQVYLYEQLDDVQRVYLHEDIARTLETLYGNEVGRISLTLAHHYQEAGMMKQAIDFLILASQESVRVVAFEESYQHLTRALNLLAELPEGDSRDRQELSIQKLLGQFWSISKGYGVPEVETAYTHALELSRKLNSNQQTLELLFALSNYSQMHNDISSLRQYGEESLLLADDNKDPKYQMQVDKIWHFITFSEGRFFDAVTYADAIITYYRKHRPELTREEAIDLSTMLTRRGFSLVPCGYTDRAISSAREGLNLANQHGTPLNIGINMAYTTKVYFECRDWQATIDLSEQVLDIANQYGFTQMRTFTEMMRGISLAMHDNFSDGKALVLRAVAERRLTSPFGELAILNLLAEACAKNEQIEEGLGIINEVLSLLKESDDRLNEPEIYHVKGQLLLQQNQEGEQLKQNQAEAERYFRQSIEISRERMTKLWELRALASLCQLLHHQGRKDECYQQLADLYSWFTEGFETEDLRRAQTILQELE